MGLFVCMLEVVCPLPVLYGTICMHVWGCMSITSTIWDYLYACLRLCVHYQYYMGLFVCVFEVVSITSTIWYDCLSTKKQMTL